MPRGQARIVLSIRKESDRHTEHGADRDVVDVVSVVLTTGDGYHCRTQERSQGDQNSGEVASRSEYA